MADFENAGRLRLLLDRWETRLLAAFTGAVLGMRQDLSTDEIEQALQNGTAADLIDRAARRIRRFSRRVNDAYVGSGDDAAEFLTKALGIEFDFDRTNARAVQVMATNRLGILQEFTRQQRENVGFVLSEATADGLNPREAARRFRQTVGLTSQQTQFVSNYRRQLEQLDSGALRRQLRDKRFDRSVQAAINSGAPLAAGKREKLVSRYRDRWVKHRAETIARTEALSAVHQGSGEMFSQAIGAGELNPQNLIQIWNTAGDDRVRDSHETMNGQEQLIGVPFMTGNGAALMHPGDPSAPASEIIDCRCVVGVRVTVPQTALAR